MQFKFEFNISKIVRISPKINGLKVKIDFFKLRDRVYEMHKFSKKGQFYLFRPGFQQNNKKNDEKFFFFIFFFKKSLNLSQYPFKIPK